jgi:hypothetical protein
MTTVGAMHGVTSASTVGTGWAKRADVACPTLAPSEALRSGDGRATGL